MNVNGREHMIARLNLMAPLAVLVMGCLVALPCSAQSQNPCISPGNGDVQMFPPCDWNGNPQPQSANPQVLAWDGQGNMHYIPGFTGDRFGNVIVQGNANISGTALANTVTANAVNAGTVTAANALAITSSTGSLTIGTGAVLDVNALNLLNNLKTLQTCDTSNGYAVVKNAQGMFDCEQVSNGTLSGTTSGSGGTGSGVAQMVVSATAPSCNASTNGLLWFNTNISQQEYCNGTTFVQFVGTASYQPPTPPSNSGFGYFVLSNGTYNGNLGGLDGASATCLSELTTNTNWKGYADAQSKGELDGAHVQAFLCYTAENNFLCNNLLPATAYYFAKIGDSSIGGASFTTDQNGQGPGDSTKWSSNTYFGTTTYNYWTDRDSYYATGTCGESSMSLYFTTNGGSPCGSGTQKNSCSAWTSSVSTKKAYVGQSNKTDYNRWNTGSLKTCNTLEHLICFVNPNP